MSVRSWGVVTDRYGRTRDRRTTELELPLMAEGCLCGRHPEAAVGQSGANLTVRLCRANSHNRPKANLTGH